MESIVFLRIDPKAKNKTVYYYLAVPNEDFEKPLALPPTEYGNLHHTAVSQVLMFSLLAFKSNEIEKYQANLETWTIDDDILRQAIPPSPEPPEKSTPSFRPSPKPKPIDYTPFSRRLRPKETESRDTCIPGFDRTRKDKRDPSPSEDDEPSSLDIAPPSQTKARVDRGQQSDSSIKASSSSSGDRRRAFCTESCLQGLVRGDAFPFSDFFPPTSLLSLNLYS